jgi:DNA polymerase-3 subunit epsilon
VSTKVDGDPGFLALDLETANPSIDSICQIGIADFTAKTPPDHWVSLLNPEDYFHGVNVSIHGITETNVRNSPVFPTVYDYLRTRLENKFVVHHTYFDRSALNAACQKYGLAEIHCTWLDSAKIVRRVWPEFSRRGYGLKSVAEKLNIQFDHHNALEDARAAGEITIQAMKTARMNLYALQARIKQPIDPDVTSSRIHVDANPDGPLFGEEMVFTGSLSIPRREAARIAAQAGCNVSASVRRTTTIVVVGDQDIKRLHGHEKSAKHRKAQELITEGYPIRLLGESDFLRVLNYKKNG